MLKIFEWVEPAGIPSTTDEMWHADSLIKSPDMKHTKRSASMPDGITYIIINPATLNKNNSYYDSSLNHSRLDSVLQMCPETQTGSTTAVFFCGLHALLL